MTRNKLLLSAMCLALTMAASFWYGWRREPSAATAIRVGVDHSPPFYSIQPDGTVRGLAVDVLNEAARRRKIRLIWIPLHDIPLDDALSKRIVQIWPLVGSTPERKTKLYLSRPWLENDYVLTSLAEHPIWTPDDASGQVVAQARLKSTTAVVQQFLPRVRPLVKLFRADAVAAVCSGEAAAAVVESRVLDAILLTRPPGCESAKFHISTVAGATSPLSIAAVPEMRATADALRDEIKVMTQNGFLSTKLDEWSPFTAEGTRSVWAEEAAEERSRIYRYYLILILVLSVIPAWLAYKTWQLKKAAERAESGRREAQRQFTAFMDNSPALAFMKDAAGRLLYANKAWSKAIGLDPQNCYGRDDFDLFPPDVARQIRANDLELLSGNTALQVIEAVPTSEVESREFLVVKFPFANEKGDRFLGGTAIDITERESATRELAASESRYRELFERNPLPAWVYDRTTLEFMAVNDAAVKRYGWSREDFESGMKLQDLIPPTEMSIVGWDAETMDRAYTKASGWRHHTKDGLILRVEVTSYELDYMQRQARLMIVRDITDEERTLEQLRVSEERWQLALMGAGDALWDWDLVTGRVFRSPRWSLMLGYDEATVWNGHEDFLRLLHPDDAEATEAAVKAHLARQTPVFAAEYRMLHRDGSWRWMMDRGQAVWNERGIPVRMAGSQADITERKNAENLLARQARTDGLTGLANRREFDRRFAEQVQKSRAGGEELSVCVCDVDRFKEVNDSYGHAVGDRVLMKFAAILRENCRKSDLLARIGGDEFVLVLPGTSLPEACALVERIREQLHREAFLAGDTAFHVSSSFGVAGLRGDHADPAQLIIEADRFLYAAKNGGRNKTLTAA